MQVNWIYIFPTQFDISLKQSKKYFLRGHRVCIKYILAFKNFERKQTISRFLLKGEKGIFN